MCPVTEQHFNLVWASFVQPTDVTGHKHDEGKLRKNTGGVRLFRKNQTKMEENIETQEIHNCTKLQLVYVQARAAQSVSSCVLNALRLRRTKRLKNHRRVIIDVLQMCGFGARFARMKNRQRVRML